MKCKFCEVAQGKREKENVILEDGEHIAFLDVFPIYKGQILVIPKKHIGGLDLFKLKDRQYADLMLFAKKVERKIRLALKPQFVCLVVEGTGVNHLHVKLYPIINVKKWAEKRPKKLMPYLGYLATWLGPRAEKNELIKLAEKIKKAI